MLGFDVQNYGLLALLCIAGVINALLSFYVASKKTSKTSKTFALVFLLVSFWSFTYALELYSNNLVFSNIFYKLKYVVIAFVPVAWFFFILSYTGKKKWVTKKNFILFSLIPIVSLILVFTNNYHHLFWSSLNFENAGVLTQPNPSYGFFFWIYTLYSYVLILSGVFLVFNLSMDLRLRYIKKVLSLIAGAIIPFAGNLVTIVFPLFFNYDVNYDLSPMLFPITGIIYSWALFHYKFIETEPIARNQIFENIEDAIFVLDKNHKIIDYNNSAKAFLEKIDENHKPLVINDQKIEDFIPEIQDIVEHLSTDPVSDVKQFNVDNETHFYDIDVNHLFDDEDELKGTLIFFRNATEEEKAKQKLEQKIDELQRFKKVTVGRELKVRELKDQIKQLQENNSNGGDTV